MSLNGILSPNPNELFAKKLTVDNAVITAASIGNISGTIGVSDVDVTNITVDNLLITSSQANLSLPQIGVQYFNIVSNALTGGTQLLTGPTNASSYVELNRGFTNSVEIGGDRVRFRDITGAAVCTFRHNSTGNSFVNPVRVLNMTNSFGNILYTVNQQVGIGVTAPTTSLDISGGSLMTNLKVGRLVGGDNVSFGFDDNNATGYRLGMVKKAGSGPVFACASTGNFTFSECDSADIDGNVSIKTYTPLLTIGSAGNVNISGKNSQISSVNQTNSSSAISLVTSSGVQGGGITAFGQNQAGGLLLLNSGSNGLEFRSGTSAGLVNFSATSNTFVLPTRLAHNSNTLGNLYTTGGNVGIGTVTPGATLDVSGTLRASASVTTGTLAATNITSTNLVTTNASISSLSISGVSLTNFTASNALITNASMSNLNVSGTSVNPGVQVIGLNVPASFKVQNSTAGNGSLEMAVSNATDQFSLDSIQNDAIIRTSSGNLILQTGGGASQFYIATSGNIGIKNSSPAFDLDVSGTLRVSSSITTGNISSTNVSSNAAVITNITSTNLVSTNASMTNLSISGASMSISSASMGLYDIQNTNSSSGISLTTVSGVQGGGVTVFGANQAAGLLLLNSGANGLEFRSGTSGGLVNFTASQNTFQLPSKFIHNSNTLGTLFTTGGNVGIGTTSPAFNLDVTGTIFSSDKIRAFNYQTNILGGLSLAQAGMTFTVGNQTLEYAKTGGLINCVFDLAVTAAGTATGDLTLNLPFNSALTKKYNGLYFENAGVTQAWSLDTFAGAVGATVGNTNDIGFPSIVTGNLFMRLQYLF